ncbi:magnesium transporter [Cellulomonas sp. NPDC089187]|uniref:magnesium transporter n=1 Tax=Cellulomonas sp. NPDC089187 TaxID=3154970 RepID=UPI0034241BB4
MTPPTTALTDLDLHDVLSAGTPRAVEIWLDTVPDRRGRSDQLADLSDAQVRNLVRLLRPDTARELFGSLDPHAVAEVLQLLPPRVAAGLVDSMESDTAAEVLRAADDELRALVLSAMGIARSAVVRGLLAWPEDSAAAQMNPDVVTVRPTQDVREAVAEIQHQSPAEDTTEVYVTTPDDDGRQVLRGVVSFRDLVLAPADAMVADLMRDEPICVDATADQERAARLLNEHRLAALPVVDDGRLVGVLSPDDVADIMEEETTEDAARQGGSEPLEVPYLRASPWLLWRKRVVWMLALFLAEMYTGSVLRAFEEELATVVALTFFVPLLIGTGGNAGTQITTTLIRAMATGEVRLRDVPRVLAKEMTTGSMIAVTMAVMAFIRAWTLGVGLEVGLTVAVSAAAIVLWASLMASVLPLVLRRIGIDPAVVSGPMIATIVDGTGLMIYFTVARLFISALG